MTPLEALSASELSEVEKALVVIFMNEKNDGMSAKVIASSLEAAGHAIINRSRLTLKLKADKRVIIAASGFKISARHRSQVESLALPYTGPVRPKNLSGPLDPEIFRNARGYVQNVLEQINASYGSACYDCAAVMIRRLLETLIVDAFEHQGHINDILNDQGNIHQLGALISILKSTTKFSISRQTKEAASHLKNIGDWSAHNRRHRAHRSDIEVAIQQMRLAASDLLHLAGQD